MTKIVDIQMVRLGKLLEERKIAIKLEPAAREWLAEKGWDPAYGARPLKRVIQKSIQDPLAELILAGSVKDGEKVDDLGRQAGADLQRQARRGGVTAQAEDGWWPCPKRRTTSDPSVRASAMCGPVVTASPTRCGVPDGIARRRVARASCYRARSRSLSKPASTGLPARARAAA